MHSKRRRLSDPARGAVAWSSRDVLARALPTGELSLIPAEDLGSTHLIRLPPDLGVATVEQLSFDPSGGHLLVFAIGVGVLAVADLLVYAAGPSGTVGDWGLASRWRVAAGGRPLDVRWLSSGRDVRSTGRLI